MIAWEQFARKGEPKNAEYGSKTASVDIWHGKVGNIKNAVLIQGPTAHNGKFRVFAVLRWKDAVHVDEDSLPKAKKAARRLVREWLDASGLSVRRSKKVN